MQDSHDFEKFYGEIRRAKQALLKELNVSHDAFAEKLKALEDEADLRHPDQYAKSVSKELLAHSEPLLTDEFKNMVEVVALAKDRIKETSQYIEISSKRIQETENEILSYKNMIQELEKSLTEKKPSPARKGISNDQIEKARSQFKEMKATLHKMVNTLYPQYAPELSAILGELCEKKFNPECSEYVYCDESLNYILVEFLKIEGIVSTHPHDKQKFKLAL